MLKPHFTRHVAAIGGYVWRCAMNDVSVFHRTPPEAWEKWLRERAAKGERAWYWGK